jgi:hypothetical protein
MEKLIAFIKKHFLPIILILGGIIDQSTDLFVQLLTEINAPAWVATLFRISVVIVGALKLYFTTSPNGKKTK